MGTAFTQDFLAAEAGIDMLGHVNNAVWVRWMEDMAVAHWHALAPAAAIDAAIWVVVRHEIDYRGNVGAGARVTGRTWIDEPPVGARFARSSAFSDADGRTLVSARTVWAMIDRASGRVRRIPPELAAIFLA